MATFLNNPFRVLLTVLILAGAGPVFSQGSDSGNEDTAVAERVEDLKKKVIRLNRDLFILEEDLLFPASTRIAVFLSVDTGKFLELDAVKLKVNDEIVASHLYTERQVKALERGGMQRLYVGNLKTGEHEITAFVEGTGPDNRVYKQAASFGFEKGTGTAALEIRVEDRSSNYQPSVSIVEWE
ncbi:AraC family transcriptional regulator [Marinobacter sp. SS8-8]|uniref:AraC family transcriptional regulator n=1 Tax=Marinobacter sp. SS8-8 TaxID=3050452 RepID=UPI000C403901|nr:AraC family transcriptional regulator [Marinobacter sp. SS8-8]MAZ06742.1 AraC family transcriptional regulator [Halomonas sp.]|tara:strand:- start:30 stop:578 length:549 start_codon:yes stop_codon:yes gene_type:complete